MKIILVAISGLIILSLGSTIRGQGGGREPPKSNPTKPPASKPSTSARKSTAPRSNSPAFRPTNPHIELVRIPPGSFMMGSTNGGTYEKPVHRVTINYSFYMGKYEVTQAQWQAVMGTSVRQQQYKANKSSPLPGEGDKYPMYYVNRSDAQDFIKKLNSIDDSYSYRLPTEAEWEYACRAGTTTEFAFGDAMTSAQANFDGTKPYGAAATGVFRQTTTPVGSFSPNAWGLYDMHGNVMEWCEDVWHFNYNDAPADGAGWVSGENPDYRVLRGGTWNLGASAMRSAGRTSNSVDIRANMIGFRLIAIARTQ